MRKQITTKTINKVMKIWAAVIMLVTVVMFSGCSKSMNTPKGDVVSLFVNVENTTRAEAVVPSRYIMEFYENGDLTSTPKRVEQASSSFDITLVDGKKYVILLYADEYPINNTDSYNATSLQALCVNMKPDKSCYSTALSFTYDPDSATKEYLNPILTNSVAQLNFIQSSSNFTSDNNNLSVTFKSNYSYNVANGTVTALGSEKSCTFFGIAQSSSNKTIGTAYIFANKDTQTVIDMTISFNEDEDNSKTITNVPFQCNHRTNITGSFAAMGTSSKTINCSINSDWESNNNSEQL